MQRLCRLLREPVLRGLVLALWLALFSWPFWSDPAYRAIGFLFPYHLACWLALVLILMLMAWSLGRAGSPEDPDADDDGQL
ncbi:MAG: hypothetical protein V1806_07945 [Pseudomonadota bacterium]